MKIIWSDLAQEYYLKILEELFEKWNITIVNRFENEIITLISKISEFNHICPKSKISSLHKCLVNKNISLIYRIENNTIEIVTLLFNQSDHLY